MSEYRDEEELERINKEIEEELGNYDSNNDTQKEKKQFLTLRFFCTLILVVIMTIGIVRMFI